LTNKLALAAASAAATLTLGLAVATTGLVPAVAANAERVQPRALPARPLPARAAVDAPRAAVRKPRPDPGPLRIALALTGMATASALVTALLGSVSNVAADVVPGGTDQSVGAAPAAPAASVQHVTKIVQLAPGQTAPPKSIVKQQPAPTPRVNVVVTKQSGK
jgi:hypothetical protein